MYTLLKQQGIKKFFLTETPSLGASLLVSELTFKFGSFMLECSAFLVTWYTISFISSHFFSRRKEALS